MFSHAPPNPLAEQPGNEAIPPAKRDKSNMGEARAIKRPVRITGPKSS